MAQRPDPGPPNWVNDFIPDSFFRLNSPGVPTVPSNINNPGEFTSADSPLFQKPENHNNSAGPLQDHTLQTPFSIDVAHGTDSKLQELQDQSKKLVDYLLHDVKHKVFDKLKMYDEEIKRLNDENKMIIGDMKRLNDRFVELTAACKELGPKMSAQLRKELEYSQQRPVRLIPWQGDNNKTPQ